MKTIWRRVRLFRKIVFRDWESKGSIPEPYRIKYKLSPHMAWWICCTVHPRNE